MYIIHIFLNFLPMLFGQAINKLCVGFWVKRCTHSNRNNALILSSPFKKKKKGFCTSERIPLVHIQSPAIIGNYSIINF